MIARGFRGHGVELGHDSREDADDRLFLDEVMRALQAGGELPPDEMVLPLADPRDVAAALVGRGGKVMSANEAFTALGGERLLDPERLAQAAVAGPTTAVVQLAPVDGVADTALVAYGLASRAAAWRLPPEVAAAAAQAPRQIVVLICHAGHGGRALEGACRAYGLSGLQVRVTLETIRTGQVKAAAARAGVSFHTAREALAQAMRRVGVTRLAALVETITSLSFGVLPRQGAGGVLQDVWGLSRRQAAIAGLISDGLTRRETGRALGVSEAVVRKELEDVFLLLQVGSAAALARKVVETNALRWLIHATDGDVGLLDAAAEPLQFVRRPDGRRIAISDYGPRTGRPVLVPHTSLTTRIVPSGLLRALHGAGYRPIAIDRPGFGLSDEIPGTRGVAHDPHGLAAQDTLTVLDRLNIRSVDVAGRGGSYMLVALQQRAPERLGRVVLINPGLYAAEEQQWIGGIGAIKDAFRRNPLTIRLFVRALGSRMTLRRTEAAMRRWLAPSAADLEALGDPELVRDYFRAVRHFATGQVAGFVSELTHQQLGARPPRLTGVSNWRVLVGAHDTMHGAEPTMASWSAILPDARFTVHEDAGRLLPLSHPHYVLAALQGD